MKRENFNELPTEIQNEIRKTLRAFDSVDVWFEYGRYTFGSCLKASYGADHRFVGTYTAEEVYTENERIANYINEFLSYPSYYKGAKCWDDIQLMKKDRSFKDGILTHWVGAINEAGNFELTAKISERV